MTPSLVSPRVSRRWRLAAAVALAIALPVQADSVTDWNALASSGTVLPRFGGPQQQSRAMAIVQVAVHDALNAIDERYEFYNAQSPAAPGASPDAAVAAAARTALLAMIDALPTAPTPAEAANRLAAINAINAAFDAAIGPGAPSASEQAGINAGDAAADDVIAQRYAFNGTTLVPTDGSGTPNSPAYALPPGLGVHQPTPAPEFPAVTLPQFTGWPYVTPFAVKSATQFRAPKAQIFNLRGAQYTSEYNYVKKHGDARVRGANPDSEMSNIPRFWAGGGLEWNANVRLIVAGRGLDRWEHARLFALVDVAIADAFITNMESKYLYNFWRPVTAIRWADDGNPRTASDPTWRPFLQTPPYPDYPCASTVATGAAAQMLRRYFRTNRLGFTRTINAPSLPLPAPMTDLPAKAITRSYATLSQAEDEQAMGRVYAGIHFREGCFAGLHMGNEVADWVYARTLRP